MVYLFFDNFITIQDVFAAYLSLLEKGTSHAEKFLFWQWTVVNRESQLIKGQRKRNCEVLSTKLEVHMTPSPWKFCEEDRKESKKFLWAREEDWS